MRHWLTAPSPPLLTTLSKTVTHWHFLDKYACDSFIAYLSISYQSIIYHLSILSIIYLLFTYRHLSSFYQMSIYHYHPPTNYLPYLCHLPANYLSSFHHLSVCHLSLIHLAISLSVIQSCCLRMGPFWESCHQVVSLCRHQRGSCGGVGHAWLMSNGHYWFPTFRDLNHFQLFPDRRLWPVAGNVSPGFCALRAMMSITACNAAKHKGTWGIWQTRGEWGCHTFRQL